MSFMVEQLYNCTECGKPIMVRELHSIFKDPFKPRLCKKCYKSWMDDPGKKVKKERKCTNCGGSGKVKGYNCMECYGKGKIEWEVTIKKKDYNIFPIVESDW